MKQQYSKSDQTITATGIASYFNGTKARAAVEGAEPKFSTQLIVTDEKSINAINHAVEAAKHNGIGIFGGKIPPTLKLPLRNGNEERPGTPEYKDAWFCNANSTKKPDIVDKNLEPIIDSSELYSGMKIRVKLTAFPYSVNGNKGVGLALGNIQKISDGDPLGGQSRSAADDFEVYKESTADMLS
jgi:hypothetical protein